MRIDRERGATAVEYAMGVSLFALVLIAAIAGVRSAGEDRFDSSIDLTYDAGDAPAVTTTSTPPTSVPPTTTTTTTAPPPTGNASTSAPTFSQGSPASKWNASFTVTVTDTSGNPLSGVTVTGSWDTQGSPSGTCVTGAAGTCTISNTGINDNDPDAVWAFTSMSGATQGSIAGSPITVSCPDPATCD